MISDNTYFSFNFVPNNSCHLISVQFNNWILDFDFAIARVYTANTKISIIFGFLKLKLLYLCKSKCVIFGLLFFFYQMFKPQKKLFNKFIDNPKWAFLWAPLLFTGREKCTHIFPHVSSVLGKEKMLTVYLILERFVFSLSLKSNIYFLEIMLPKSGNEQKILSINMRPPFYAFCFENYMYW